VIPTATGVLAIEPGVVKMSTVEIFPVIPFERGAIVSVVVTIPVVSVPNGVIIVGIAGEFVVIDHAGGLRISVLVRGSGCISILVNRGRSLVNDWCGNRSGINPDSGQAQPYVCVDIYLRVSGSRYKAGGDNGGKYNYLFHICRF